MTTVRRITLVWLAALLSVVFAASAWADHIDNLVPTDTLGDGDSERCLEFLDPNVFATPCLGDNSSHTYYLHSPGDAYPLEEAQGDRDAVRRAMNEEYDPTDLNISYDSSPTFSGNAETDVIFQEENQGIPSGNIGIAWCNDTVDDTRWQCDQAYVRIGENEYVKKVACHETGHTVGLTHGAQASTTNGNDHLGCMQAPKSETVPTLGANQVANINGYYS